MGNLSTKEFVGPKMGNPFPNTTNPYVNMSDIIVSHM